MIFARTDFRTLPLIALCAAALVAGCAATTGQDTAPAAGQSMAAAQTSPTPQSNLAPQSRITGMENPTTPADLPQTASILEVERYRPNYQIKGCSPSPVLSSPPEGKLAEAVKAAQAYSDEQKGLGLMVLQEGVLKHIQFADGVDGQTLFASASMMKSVVALLYGIAIEDGVIGSLDDRVGDYLAEWDADPRGDITLRQLMTMSAGLGQSNFLEILLAPDIGQAALKVPMVGKPDTDFSYNNAITKLLTLVLDRQLSAKGKGSLLSYLERELWCPIGNSDAMVWVDQQGEARGYAGLHASLVDYARIGELIRKNGVWNGERIVPADWLEEMATPSKANAQYGLHVWLGAEHTAQRAYSAANPIKIPHAEPFEAKDIIYFDGFGGQRVYIIPSKQLVIARFGEVNLAYDDSVIPNLLTRAVE